MGPRVLGFKALLLLIAVVFTTYTFDRLSGPDLLSGYGILMTFLGLITGARTLQERAMRRVTEIKNAVVNVHNRPKEEVEG